MITEPFTPLRASLVLVAFLAGISGGMWFLPVALSEEEAVLATASQHEQRRMSMKRSRRDGTGRDLRHIRYINEMGNLERLLLNMDNNGLTDEEIEKMIYLEDIPDILAELRAKPGALGYMDPRWPDHLDVYRSCFKDVRLLVDLVRYYYHSSPEEAIEWLKDLPKDQDRTIMVMSIMHGMSLEAIRPLAQELSPAFDAAAMDDLYRMALERGAEGFVETVQLEIDYLEGNSRGSWRRYFPNDFDFAYAMNEVSRMDDAKFREKEMLIPLKLYNAWETNDADAAHAWRKRNPRWNPQMQK